MLGLSLWNEKIVIWTKCNAACEKKQEFDEYKRQYVGGWYLNGIFLHGLSIWNESLDIHRTLLANFHSPVAKWLHMMMCDMK